MRYSEYFLPTMKETPSDAEVMSHKLMMRAGMMNKVAAGIYNYLPLGLRVIRKVENIVHDCMDEAGAIEVLMSSVQPAELWEESGRWGYYGSELLRFKDRHGRDFCMGPTHEEVITDIVRSYVKSYRQLPINLYQVQTKFRDEIRPRFGLMRGREFIMKDAYSFDTTEEGANLSYDKMRKAYCKIFERCGLEYRMVEADSGAIGGSFSHEFMVLADTGEDMVISCDGCDYSANIEKAIVIDSGVQSDEPMIDLERVETPGAHTVDAVSEMLKLKPSQVVKTMIVIADEELIAVLVRGDHELNESKLKNLLGVQVVELAAHEQIMAATGGPIGFSGPVGLDIPIYADNAVKYLRNICVGGNEKPIHLVGVNLERDFSVKEFDDLRDADAGDPCPKCSGNYINTRGIEVGHIFKLGTNYSESMKATFLDDNGRANNIIMGCYGIGIGRTAAAAIEQNHDDQGIIFPMAIAPFHVVVTVLNIKDEEVVAAADELYDTLCKAGIEVLIDDRKDRPGAKFKDADLIGIPLRVTVGGRALKEGVFELRDRKTGEVESLVVASAADDIIGRVRQALAR